ncbi:hypothetical protein ACH5RR_033401 [Cinchona calisaya]|uniref:Uncharacterized protein n=1 Tax=Cinchona calisaya TaxID=153742 RepID=A0ABD2YKV6_9GENT
MSSSITWFVIIGMMHVLWCLYAVFILKPKEVYVGRPQMPKFMWVKLYWSALIFAVTAGVGCFGLCAVLLHPEKGQGDYAQVAPCHILDLMLQVELVAESATATVYAVHGFGCQPDQV